ncbi:MAG: hypothetical protein CMJ58_24865 [Planctomycetaceae bacterium]|nr:hypothetical protein [Planctomycetaceae bacterium]
MTVSINIRRTLFAAMACVTAFSCFASRVDANEIYSPVVSPVTASPQDIVPRVDRVPGKKFTDSLDMDYVPSPHSPQPSQLGQFDGLGGAQNDLLLAIYGGFADQYNVDAQSQIRDVLFDAARENRAPLIVSTSFDQMLGADVALAAEQTTGAVQSFATRSQVVNHPHAGGVLRDIDSVDLWGPEDGPAAGFYSFENEPGGNSIYTLQTLAPGFLLPYVTAGEIAGAIGNTALTPQIDVDALMVRDVGTGLNPFDGEFGPGDSIMFSIEPIVTPEGTTLYDGGEIWVWDFGQPAEFLKHGGHVWDTAFDVAGTLKVNTENIDALEAAGVPEPAANVIAACLLGAGALARRTRRT